MQYMLILASQSPRRRELLGCAGIPFEVRPASVDEARVGQEDPGEHVCRLAREKAQSVACAPDEIVLGADTVVVVDGEVLGKPLDREHAARMLRQLSGRAHEVVTGICLRTSNRLIVDKESTRVRFVRLPEEEIAAYVASGEPMDKAGAYAIQGLASRFIDRIEGCYCNVVGLPVALVWRHLQELAAFPPKEPGKL
jgi:septum formation protein